MSKGSLVYYQEIIAVANRDQERFFKRTLPESRLYIIVLFDFLLVAWVS